MISFPGCSISVTEQNTSSGKVSAFSGETVGLLLHGHTRTCHHQYSCSSRSTVRRCVREWDSKVLLGQKRKKQLVRSPFLCVPLLIAVVQMSQPSILHTLVPDTVPDSVCLLAMDSNRSNMGFLLRFGRLSLQLLGTLMALPEQSAG